MAPEWSRAERWSRIAAGFVTRQRDGNEASSLCTVCQELLGLSGAGIVLAATGHVARLCASDRTSEALEDLQFTLGEGPSVDVAATWRPVFDADLQADSDRWPAFAGPAVEAGVRAVFAFPLMVGAARLGTLTLYRDRPGPLSAETEADATAVADVLVQTILVMQARAAPDMLADSLGDVGFDRAEVHQAAGMISVQLGVGIVEALVRLRSHAYSSGRPIDDVARDVVARRLRFGAPGDVVEWSS